MTDLEKLKADRRAALDVAYAARDAAAIAAADAYDAHAASVTYLATLAAFYAALAAQEKETEQ